MEHVHAMGQGAIEVYGVIDIVLLHGYFVGIDCLAQHVCNFQEGFITA